MLTLYDYLPSQNAWKVRLLLNHIGKPYKQEFISIFEGEGKSQNYLAVNPTGAVPSIRTTDGQTIAESNAILVYLSQGTPFLPIKPIQQSQVLQWLFFEADYVQASIATLRHWVLTGKDISRSTDILNSKHASSLNVLSILDAKLESKPFLSGQDYTIADMSVFAYVHLAEEANLPLHNYTNVQRWIEAVRSQPGFLRKMYPYSIDEHSTNEL